MNQLIYSYLWLFCRDKNYNRRDIYYVIKENVDALLVTNKEFRLKMNAERTMT